MNPRQVRLGIDLFTALVVASVGVALAGLTWRLAGYSGARPVTAAITGASSEPVDIGVLLALAPFGTAEAANDAASNGSLHLKGILLAVPASGSTALIAGSDGKVVSYGIGAVLGGGVVEAIQTEQVILRTPHGLQTVGFAVAASGPAAATLGPRNTGTGFVPVGAAPSASSQTGFRIDNAAPAALFAAGLKLGDIVEDVNGAPVNAGTVQRDLASAALRGKTIHVVVLRNGNRVSLRLAIH